MLNLRLPRTQMVQSELSTCGCQSADYNWSEHVQNCGLRDGQSFGGHAGSADWARTGPSASKAVSCRFDMQVFGHALQNDNMT